MECFGELVECFGSQNAVNVWGSLWNVSEACGMFRKLVDCFGSLCNAEKRKENRFENGLAA